MRVLITGAGLIGCHLAGRLTQSGEQVVLFDLAPNHAYIKSVAGAGVEVLAADLRDLPALLGALARHEIDTVVHTAGLIGRRVAENSYTGSTNNIIGTIHVLEAARLSGVRRVVYVSTFGVYDRARIKTGPIHEDAPTGGHNLYSVTKLCSEQLVTAYQHLYHLDTIIVRPAGVFGRGHYVGGSTVGRVMHDLAQKLARREPVELDAKVYSANEYVYAKDVAAALASACTRDGLISRVYNVGSGTITPVSELARIVEEIAPGVRVTGAAGNDGKEWPLDLSRASAELGYRPRFGLQDALRDYVEELRSGR